jgi:hypothetical protein
MADFSSFLLGGSPEKSKYSVEDVQNMIFAQESNSGKAKTDVPNYAGAVGPMQITKPTFETLKKKGLIPVEYDINNPVHNKEAGNALISDAYNRHGGDADKVLAEYYAGPNAIKNGQIQADLKDLKNPNAPNVAQYIEQAKSKIGEMGDSFSNFLMGGSASKTEKIVPEQLATPQTQPKSLSEASARAKKDLEPIANILPSVASLADTTVGSVLPFIGKQATYAVGRALQQTPAEAEATSTKVSEFLDKPFGKALGVTEAPAYKGEASQQLMTFISENINKGAEWIAQKTGLPVNDVQNMIGTATLAVGKGAEVTAKPVAKTVGNFLKEREIPLAELQGQFQAKKAPQTTVSETVVPEVATPEYIAEKGTARPYQVGNDFKELKYDEKVLPKDEQQARLEVLNRTAPNLTVDPNVIEGRGKDRATDYQVSKTDTPEGNLLAEKLKEEKLAKTAYGEKLINDTGGTYGLDESSNYRRGNNTIGYFQKLETHFDDAIKNIYTERDKVAGGIPVNGENIKSTLSNEVTLELGDNAKLAKAANAKLKQLGMMDKDGNMLPSNGFKAEQFRKWLNEEGVWDKSNSVLHRELKNAVDADVISTLDPNTSVYADARNLFKLKKDTLENPNGISKILEAEGPNGINRKVDIEKIPNSIAGLGVDQITHIIDTIDKAPPALKQQAELSRSEIKSQFVNRLHEAFERNANAGTKYLKDNKEVMNRLFTPEEMAEINDYNSLSHILKTETGYPGAKVQEINIDKRLPTLAKEFILKKGAAGLASAVTGGHTLGLAETIAHGAMSERIAKKDLAKTEKLRKESFEKKQKGFTNLKDLGK